MHDVSLIRKIIKRTVAGGFIIFLIFVAKIFIYGHFNPPITMTMLWKLPDGNGVDQRWVKLDDIAPILLRTVIMTEDNRFCAHSGIDRQALKTEIKAFLAGSDARGASTITMQIAKNLFLWPRRSYLRKLLELPIAVLIDLTWSKRRVMEVYLNVVEWGPGIYGAEAASRHHFSRSANRLTARQAALLAAILPSPITRNAGKPDAATNRLAHRAERRGRVSLSWTDCLFNGAEK